jgi:Leucine-rich repeat (LRR) protein
VFCDDAGFVKSIELYLNRLSGALPAELKLLKDTLEEIDFYRNLFYNSGDEGHEWLGELTNLRRLYYGSTYFEYDGIPSAIIGKLTNLEEYDCSYCLYNGSLTEDLFSSNLNLNYLYISGNNYNSSIPSKLASLPNLEYLYVEDAGLTGDLSFVSDLSVVAELWIGKNPGLKGTVPTEIGELSSLRSLSLNSCSLTGTLPVTLAMRTLGSLFVEDNNLTGTMPEGICENMSPDGFLQYLTADCPDEVICDCCTCCGPNCYSS